MSSSTATADNYDVKGQKNCLQQMSATQKVENYLDFFPIKVPPDVIPMDWWMFEDINSHTLPNLGVNGCVTATSTPSERVFSNCGLALKAKRSRQCTIGSSDDLLECSLPYYHRR